MFSSTITTVSSSILLESMDADERTVKYAHKLHIERGIAHLSGTNFIKNLDDLLDLAIEEK